MNYFKDILLFFFSSSCLALPSMAIQVPQSMRALVAPRKCRPADYEVMDVPTPSITLPNHVLIRVYAASVGPSELQVLESSMSSFANITSVPSPFSQVKPRKLTMCTDFQPESAWKDQVL